MPHYMQRWTWLNKAMEEVKVELTVKKKKQDIRVCSGGDKGKNNLLN